MVMRVTVRVNASAPQETLLLHEPLTPQVLVESGKVASINVGYYLMRLVSPKADQFVDFPDKTTVKAHFMVAYFSLRGEQSIQAHYKCQFRVSEEHINTWLEEEPGSANAHEPPTVRQR
jgi:hypothetical protein